MLDFEIKQEVLPVIAINFEELKNGLAATMQRYSGLIVTEESLSACKAEQKVLAGMRTKIDNYRKDKKKEMSKPITDFENQCKELIALIENAEKPIKNGIAVFDEKKKEENRKKALDIIKETVEAHQLREKYAVKLTVLEKYTNLTASAKSVKEDIEQRVFYLVEEQAKEDEMIQVIKTTIDNQNKTIKTQLQFDDFKGLIEIGIPVSKIIERVNQMAEKIRLAENPPVEAPKEESPKEEAPVVQTQITPPEPPQTFPQEQLPIPEAAPEKEQLYFVEFRITGNKNQTAKLGQFLRDNKYIYEVLKKGAIE